MDRSLAADPPWPNPSAARWRRSNEIEVRWLGRAIPAEKALETARAESKMQQAGLIVWGRSAREGEKSRIVAHVLVARERTCDPRKLTPPTNKPAAAF
jgi:hypothetical protein